MSALKPGDYVELVPPQDISSSLVHRLILRLHQPLSNVVDSVSNTTHRTITGDMWYGGAAVDKNNTYTIDNVYTVKLLSDDEVAMLALAGVLI